MEKCIFDTTLSLISRNFDVKKMTICNNTVLFNEIQNKQIVDVEKEIIKYLNLNKPEFSVKEKKKVYISRKGDPDYYYINIIVLENILNYLYKNTALLMNCEINSLIKNKLNYIFELGKEVSRTNRLQIREHIKNEIMLTEVFIIEFEKIYRYLEYVLITNKLTTKPKLKVNKNLKVIIYGAGKLGVILSKILKKDNIQVLYFIDNYSGKTSIDNIKVIKIETLNKIEDYDLIIVTPIYDYEIIVIELQKYTNKDVCSIADIFEIE